MPITEEQANAIGRFYASVDELKNQNIVRSDKYLGDIAEFLAMSAFGMALAESQYLMASNMFFARYQYV